ncbi:antibiotic biosynthesis monooxygenase family protein [Sphingobacterium sp.]|uniref:putative quinol monooxygenase n=1 Tax=Sphingobacterium sp. TaxID=341027 RepID=UPI0028AF70D8|nr:antibiotic biosynthesis monooxygenase family protein [Sphingobacterium sp.]
MEIKSILRYLLGFLVVFSFGNLFSQEKAVDLGEKKQIHLIRIAEIEVIPEYWEEYKEIVLYGARESVEKEEGVISIFPMEIQAEKHKIRILEIYRDQKAYEDHIKSKHFQHYKTSTLKMIKDLKLVDMNALDVGLIKKIFIKENISD